MTVRVERVFELDAPPEEVWSFIADPEKRARPISVVERYEVTGDRTAKWHVELPIPLLNRTVVVETEDRERDEPRYVEFVGRSKALDVRGEHTLEPDNGGTRLINRFVVDGKLPGVERFFRRQLDAELDNLELAIEIELES